MTARKAATALPADQMAARRRLLDSYRAHVAAKPTFPPVGDPAVLSFDWSGYESDLRTWFGGLVYFAGAMAEQLDAEQ